MLPQVTSADLTTRSGLILFLLFAGEVEDELLHAYSKVYTFDTPLLMVRLAVLVAVMLTVPIVLFPVSTCRFDEILTPEISTYVLT